LRVTSIAARSSAIGICPGAELPAPTPKVSAEPKAKPAKPAKPAKAKAAAVDVDAAVRRRCQWLQG
jgi:hypothetical protein